MKVFATLTTVLGASTAAQLNQLHGSNNMGIDQHSMQPSMGMSMESQMSRHGVSDRRMEDMSHQMSNMRNMYRDNQQMMGQGSHRNMFGQEMSRNMMGQEMSHNTMGQEMGHNMMGQDFRSNVRDMYRNNQDMTSNLMHRNMMGQEMSHNMVGQEIRSNMRDMQNQAFAPNQYFKTDDAGNYVYSYNDQQSEKSEEGNDQFKKGRYAYIMSNGVKRQVEYVADNNGFHIIKDNADPARIKRSSEPDLFQTKMTSVMDASLNADERDRYSMSNMLSQMDRNMLDRDQQRYSNMMGQDSMDRNMMGQHSTMGRNMMHQDNMGRNMMGRNIYNIMSNRGMTSDMSNMMGQQMNRNMMGRDITMGRNMMGQDRNSQMMGRQDMTPNMMYSNMMGQDMTNNQMSSNMISSRGMSPDMMNSRSSNGLMGQRMMQKMEIERVPETYTSTRFF